MRKMVKKTLLIIPIILAIQIVSAVTIFSDTFEDGSISDWTTTGGAGNWHVNNTGPIDPPIDSWHMISSNGNNNPVYAEKSISTSGYQSVVFSFYYKPDTNDLDCADGDFLRGEWYDGSVWNTILDICGNVPTSYTLSTNNLNSAANNNPNFKIRFGCRGGAGTEGCAIDNVSIDASLIPDTTPPVVTINFPAIGEFYKSVLNFNVSLNENGSVMYSLNGGINNKTLLFTTDNVSPFGTLFNHTNNSIADGTYTFQVYANDTNGNKNYTTSAQFTYDSTKPLISIAIPQNISYNTNNLQINFTASDTNLNSCWYSTNSGVTNTSLTNCQNTSYTAQQSSTIFVIYANDSSNNLNSSTVTFFVDSITPLINFINPTETSNSVISTNKIQITLSSTDTNLANITVQLYNSSHNLIKENISIISPFNINYTNLAEGLYYFNATTIDTLGNKNYSETRNVRVDTIIPLISIIQPQNTSYNTAPLQLNYSVSDTNLNFCGYSTNSGITNTSVTCGNNISITSSQGSNTWTIYANDSANNLNSSTVTFFVDSIIPLISYTSPTPANNSILAQNSIFINTTMTETNFANITFSLSNATSLINQTIFKTRILSINFTSLPDGTYFYNVTIKDILNNQNTTETRTIILDTTAPTLNLTIPKNISYNNIQTQLNYTIADLNLQSCWYTIDDGQTNISINCGNNVSSLNSGQGSSLWYIYANDSAGNLNSSTITFFVDSIQPLISITKPIEGQTFGTNNSLELNFTASDTNLQTCWYHIDSSSNTTIQNCANTTFNTTNGAHTLYLYANDTLNNKQLSTVNFSVSVGAPTITLLSPINKYLNSPQITFNYTATDVDLSSCELWGDFTGTFVKNLTNTTIISGQSSSFSLTLPDGTYKWNIYCNDTQNNAAFNGNKTFFIDTLIPSLELTQPSGTKTSRNNIQLIFSASDTNLQTCLYNVYRGQNIEISNTTTNCTQGSTTFDVTVDATFTLNLFANDSAGNTNSSLTTFIIDTSTPSSPGPGGGGGGGSSGGGGGGIGITPKKTTNLTEELNLKTSELSLIAIKRGTTQTFNIEVTNQGKKFLNNCKIEASLPLSSWFLSTQTKGLSPGEKFSFSFEISVPENANHGRYDSNIIINCDEGKKILPIQISIFRNSFEGKFLNYTKEVNRLKINYLLEEFEQKIHEILLKYELFDFENLLVAKGIKEKIILNPGETQQNMVEIELPKGLAGEFKLNLILSDKTTINEINKTLDLTPITGLAITETNKKALSIFGIIIVTVILLFFIIRFIYNEYQNQKIRKLARAIEHKHTKKIIKLDI